MKTAIRQIALASLAVACVPCSYLRPAFADETFRTNNRRIASGAEIKALITRLADPSFAVREAASRNLENTGFVAIEYLRRAIETSDDSEVRWRAAQIVAAYERRLRRLQKAIADEDLVEIERFVREGADVNTRSVDGSTPLHAACRKDAPELVMFLLAEGANVRTKTKNGHTPLHFVLCKRHSNHTYDPAQMAAIIKVMVKNHADVNARTEDGYTALHFSTARTRGAKTGELTALLLTAGANPKARTKRGMTPLHFAAWNGITDSARLLMDAGAEVNRLDARGKTPLDDALHRGHATLARALQQKQAKTSKQLKPGNAGGAKVRQ